MSDERNRIIGAKLRRLRKINDKTLHQVGDAVGLKENTISAYEKGKIQIPLDNLDAICSYFGTDFLTFLTEVQNEYLKNK